MSEWDEFYEEDQKDEAYDPLHFQVCWDKDCELCKTKKQRENNE